MDREPANKNQMLTAQFLEERYLRNWDPIAELAQAAECNPSTVHRALNREGVPLRGNGPDWGAVFTREYLSERLASGMSLNAIAVEVQSSARTATYWAAVHGLWESDDPRADEIVRMYTELRYPLRQIAGLVGSNTKTVKLILVSRGVTLQRAGRPSGT